LFFPLQLDARQRHRRSPRATSRHGNAGEAAMARLRVKRLLAQGLAAVLALAPGLPAALAQPTVSPNLPNRIEEYIYAGSDLGFGGKKVVMRYGNWLGPGWWGGSEKDDRVGMLPPVDDLDRTAQRHDFGYQIAEELGRGRPGVTGTYMVIADLIAIRDTLMLDRDPRKWMHPPKNVELAETFVKRLVISFEDFQVRFNQLHAVKLGRDDLTDLDTLNRMLDGLPNVAQFKAMQRDRVKKWEADYAAFQARKAGLNAPRPVAAPAPAPAPASAPRPKPATPAPAHAPPAKDCSQGSMLDQALCSHNPSSNTGN